MLIYFRSLANNVSEAVGCSNGVMRATSYQLIDDLLFKLILAKMKAGVPIQTSTPKFIFNP